MQVGNYTFTNPELQEAEIQPKPTWQNVSVLIYTMLVLVVDNYHTVLPEKAWDRLVLYFLIPLGMLWFFRRSPSDYGLQLGHWRRGLLLTLSSWILALPILWFSVQSASFRNYYAWIWSQRGPWGTVVWAITDLLGWEFFFRGFLLFSLAEISGPWAIWLQALPFTLAHLDKPELEALSCIFSGAAFGWVAWQTHSCVYPFLTHIGITVFTVWRATV